MTDERMTLVELLQKSGDGSPLSPRAKRLKSILTKLDPASLEHAVVPLK